MHGAVQLFLAALGVAFLDRATKVVALAAAGEDVPLVPYLLTATLTVNPSGPLGLPLPSIFFFILAGVVLPLVVVESMRTRGAEQFFFLLVAIGVASNTYDRLVHGYAIDAFRFAAGLVFNIADVALVVGVTALLLRALLKSTPHRPI